MGTLLFGVVCIGLFGSLLVSCNGKRKVDMDSVQQMMPQFIETENETERSSEEKPKELELIALAEDQEEAEKIAALYGIELSSFSDGVAVFTTDKDLNELKELEDINGYPTLTVNSNSHQLKEFTPEMNTSK
ncbi:MAG: hypothetical protein HFH79_01020 [Lachnospiraceae bacterium]|nr:hypothetical protein [Lachnospiraceae bacterium]